MEEVAWIRGSYRPLAKSAFFKYSQRIKDPNKRDLEN